MSTNKVDFAAGGFAVVAYVDRDWLIVNDQDGLRACLALDPVAAVELAAKLMDYATPLICNPSRPAGATLPSGPPVGPREALAMSEALVDRLEQEQQANADAFGGKAGR